MPLMNSRAYDFLVNVLGADGASALRKAVDRHEDLGNVLVPRTILSWIGIAAKAEYTGSLPGIDNTYVSFKKSERGYTGEVAVADDVYGFADASLFHLASAVAVAIGADNEPVSNPRLRDVDIAKLGKNIDLLVKARAVTQELLEKKLLDQGAGYNFKHEHGTTGNIQTTKINAFAPDGSHIGYATFHHHDNTLAPFGVYVDEAHQRNGIASHMYAVAQRLTGKTVVPSRVQTPEGSALWHGNAQQKQFGKTELPGRTAQPIAAAGPIEPTPPQRQEAARPKPAKTKPKLPRLKKPTLNIPGLPALKLSEKQLSKKCPACDGSQVKDGKFVGCICFRALVKGTELTKGEGGIMLLSFGKNWDRDSLEMFLESIRVER